ncbi:hypothetical protein L1887_62123 [Cichorium endivia]|nr:hypothetical protein L1887_62123 [Cichorium endivia]
MFMQVRGEGWVVDAGCMQTIRSGKGLRRRSDLRQPLLLRGTQSRSDRLASALVRDAPAAASPSQPASSKDTSVAKTYIRPKPPITCFLLPHHPSFALRSSPPLHRFSLPSLALLLPPPLLS